MTRTPVLLCALLAAPAFAAEVTLNPGADVAQYAGELQAGDVITFEDGQFDIEEGLWWSGPGTEESPIVLQAAQGATPVLRFSGGGNAIRIDQSSYVEIRGLVIENTDEQYDANRQNGLVIDDSTNVLVEDVEVRHVGGTGVYLAGQVSDVTLRRVHVHDTRDGSGIYAGCWDASCWTQDSSIENCWIHDVRGNGARGILLENGGQGVSIVDNVIYQTGHAGIRVASTEFGDPNVVERNVVWSTVNQGIRVDGAALVRNNIVFNVDGVGIASEDNDRGTTENIVIAHNTVVDTTDWGIWIDDWAGYEGMVLTNNVVANPVGRSFNADEDDVDENTVIRGNVFTGYVQADTLDPGAGDYAPGGGWSDFADVDGWDFYPTASSTLINAGDFSSDAWVPQDDFNGAPRDGAAPDVGAYEFLGAGNPGWVLREGFKDPGYTDNSAQDLGGCGCQGNGSEAGVFALPLFLLGWRRRRR